MKKQNNIVIYNLYDFDLCDVYLSVLVRSLGMHQQIMGILCTKKKNIYVQTLDLLPSEIVYVSKPDKIIKIMSLKVCSMPRLYNLNYNIKPEFVKTVLYYI